MKLATLRDGSRDGQLAVVSADLSLAHFAAGIAGTLQQALDDWAFVGPQLLDLAATLELGKARHAFPFEPRQAMAPLPRAPAWLLAGPGTGPDALPGAAPATEPGAEASRAATPPIPPIRPSPQAGDAFGGAADVLALPAGLHGGWCPGLAVVTGDLPRGLGPQAALDGVRLLLLGATAVAAAPPARPVVLGTHFAPVAVTPDELGAAWRHGRAALGLTLTPRHGASMPAVQADAADFGALLAEWLALRPLRAGALVGWCGTFGPGGQVDHGRPRGVDALPATLSAPGLAAALDRDWVLGTGPGTPFGELPLSAARG
jgi:fumarylacetoacetate (FAA) hydrolase